MQTCTSNRFSMYSIEASVQRKITVKRYIIKDKIAFKNLPSAANYHLSSISTFIPRLFGYNKRDSSSSFFFLSPLRDPAIFNHATSTFKINNTMNDAFAQFVFSLDAVAAGKTNARKFFTSLLLHTQRRPLSSFQHIFFPRNRKKKRKTRSYIAALVQAVPRVRRGECIYVYACMLFLHVCVGSGA